MSICQSCGGVIGRDCYNPQDGMAIYQRMQFEYEMQQQQPPSRLDTLTAHDWDQIIPAANGCVSGTSDEWPHLRNAIEKITGKPFGMRRHSLWLQGFCEGVVACRNAAESVSEPMGKVKEQSPQGWIQYFKPMGAEE